MRDFRLGRNTTEHYTSLTEAAAAFGCRPVVKKTKDEEKLKKQQNDFGARHLCKACSQPMTFIGGNQMCCANPECKGIKLERKDKDGNSVITYLTSYELLDEKGSEIAQNIYT